MEWKVDGSSRRGSMVGSERGLLWDMVVVVVWLMGGCLRIVVEE